MTILLATSIVRDAQPGDDHGNVYLVDLAKQRTACPVHCNDSAIDWQGAGGDRGLRGIACDGDRVFVAGSETLYEYNKRLQQVAAYSSPYLKYCHEIAVYKRRLFMTSAGYDALLGFDLDENVFSWGLHIARDRTGLRATPFKPAGRSGPNPANVLHLNSISCAERGLYFSGLQTRGLHVYTGKHIRHLARLPDGTHNAQPYENGVLFQDTVKNVLRLVRVDGQQTVFHLPYYNEEQLQGATDRARQGYGRGLCPVNPGIVAAGSSPATITLYDLDSGKTTLSINLSMDVCDSIHSVAVWPYNEVPDFADAAGLLMER